MKYHLALLLVLLGLVLATGTALVAGASDMYRSPVYTVSEVQTLLAHDPGAWAGKIVRVRGVAVATACTLAPDEALCGTPRFSLRDPDPAAAHDRLDLTWGPGDPVLAVLRRVPLVGAILPAPHVVRWEVVAVYRVHLRIERPCGGDCYEAVLLDAAP